LRRNGHHAWQGPNGGVENRIQPGGLPATAHEAKSLIGSFGTEKRPGCQDDSLTRSFWIEKFAPTPLLLTRCTAWTLSTTSTEVEAKTWVDSLNYLQDGMELEVVFYDGKAISSSCPPA
jgi:elongation factor P